MKFQVTSFQGLVPRVAPTLLGENQAQVAEDCDLLSGTLKPLKASADVASLPDANRLTIFPYPDTSTWLSWTTDVDVVRHPIAGDTHDRIYYTGDGGVPKVRGRVGAVQTEYPLGLPVPTLTPSVAAQAKGSVTWTRSWHYQYEAADGTVSQEGTLTEGVEVTEVIAGREYTIATLPARTTAGPTDMFVVYFDATDAAGVGLGRLFPQHSRYKDNSDFYLEGARGVGYERAVGAGGELIISYDTSRVEEYSVYRSYVYTFVTGWGEEGPPSTASTSVAISPVHDAVITNTDLTTPVGYNVTHKRIYRTVTTDAGPFFQLVIELPIATASYTDAKTDAQVTTVLPSTGWVAPSTTMAGLVSMPGGFFAGFVGRTVYFSEPYYPHAWPVGYAVTVDYDIVGLGVSENSLAVCTAGRPYVIVGSHPDSMTISRLSLRQACTSKRGIAEVQSAVVYPSPDGLVVVEGGIAQMISKGVYTRATWQALDPTTMIAEAHDMRYHAFTASATLIFDFEEMRSAITTTSESPTGLYSDEASDTLYTIQGDKIKSWGTSSTNLTATWRGKTLMFPRRGSFGICRLNATSYPQTLKVYSNGDPRATVTITDSKARRLPTLRDEKFWELEIVSDADEVYEASLATSMGEL